jgi:hypothetical protein
MNQSLHSARGALLLIASVEKKEFEAYVFHHHSSIL